MVFCGCECDEEEQRKVTFDEAASIAKCYGCPYYESSKAFMINNNVDELFCAVVREIRESRLSHELQKSRKPKKNQVQPLNFIIGKLPNSFVQSTNKTSTKNSEKSKQIKADEPRDSEGISSKIIIVQESDNKTTPVVQSAVAKLLQSIGLLQYIQQFEEFGATTLDDLLIFQDEDWKHFSMPPFHKEKICAAVNQLSPITPKTLANYAPLQQGYYQQKTALGRRQTMNPQDSVLFSGSIDTPNFIPEKSCIDCVQSIGLHMKMTKIGIIISECQEFIESLKWKPDGNPANLDENEMTAIVLYTHDLYKKGEKPENFYFQLNEILHIRSPEIMTKWWGYLFYLQNALKKIPTHQTIVYRGIPGINSEVIKKEYLASRPIYWSSFTSTTNDIKTAQSFAETGGIIFVINNSSGKNIRDYSMISSEDEILLRPNSHFVVSKPLEMRDDGYGYVELLQLANMKEYKF